MISHCLCLRMTLLPTCQSRLVASCLLCTSNTGHSSSVHEKPAPCVDNIGPGLKSWQVSYPERRAGVRSGRGREKVVGGKMRVEAPAICGAIYLSSCFFIWMSLEPVNVKHLPGLLRNSGPDALNWSELAKLHGSYFSGWREVCLQHAQLLC